MGKGSGLGMDTGKEPGTSPRRHEVGDFDRSGDHGVEQQQMNLEVDVLKGEQGQLPLKAEMGSCSNLVKRTKMRPRTRRPVAVHGSPYRHSYWRRFRNSRLHPYKRKPLAHRRKEIMKEDSACASGASGAALEATQAGSNPDTAATGSALECIGLKWSVLGPIPTVTNTLTSAIMLAEEVMCVWEFKCMTVIVDNGISLQHALCRQ